MKNKIQFLQFVAIIFFSFSTYSQVTVSVQNLQYTNNGQFTISPANCENIDLASSTSTSINLGINLSKPNGQVVGLSDLRVYTQKSSSDSRVERSWVQIQESSWNQPQNGNGTYSTGASFSINSSDFNVSGGTLFVVFKSSGGIEYQTACSFTLTKTPSPSFNFYPTTLSLACGDTSPRTFTVTPENIPSGANVTYQWSYNGWTTVSSTSTSKTLQPTSGTSLPSGISVIPSINGVAQPTLSCVVSRAAFSSAASIAGNTTICIGNNGVYTISGLGAGNTVSWSSSNTTIATVGGGTQTLVTVNGISQGLVNLIATVTNSCGQTAPPIIKPLNIGAPVMANGVIYGELWVRNNFPAQTLTFPAVLGATSYTWSISPSLDFPLNCPARGAVSAKFSNNSQTITTATPSATAAFGNCLGDYLVNCTISNACGNSVAYSRIVTVGVSGTSPCNTNFALSKTYSLSQNPIKNGEINIKKISTLVIDNPPTGDDTSEPSNVAGDGPCYQEWPKIYTGKRNLNLNNSNSQIEVKVFDFFGKLVLTKTLEVSKEEVSIKDSYLKPGKYIIHINDGNSTQKEIIIIE